MEKGGVSREPIGIDTARLHLQPKPIRGTSVAQRRLPAALDPEKSPFKMSGRIKAATLRVLRSSSIFPAPRTRSTCSSLRRFNGLMQDQTTDKEEIPEYLPSAL